MPRDEPARSGNTTATLTRLETLAIITSSTVTAALTLSTVLQKSSTQITLFVILTLALVAGLTLLTKHL